MLQLQSSALQQNDTQNSSQRAEARFLLCEPDRFSRQSLRQCLTGLGYGTISEVSEVENALEMLEEHSFTHVILEPHQSCISADNFIRLITELQPETTLITLLSQPTIHDVFHMLSSGAKGFLVKPYSIGSIDEAITTASVVEKIPEVILEAENPTEALTTLILSSLDKLAVIKRQARKFKTAEYELPRRNLALQRAIKLAHQFLEYDDETFHELITDLCSQVSAPELQEGSRALARLRQNRQKT
jgi:DNA-binding NarL/FixJ family response regulator